MLLIYDAFHFEASSGGVVTFVHSGAFHLVQDLSKDQRCGRATIWGSREARLWPPVWRSSSVWDWKGGGSSALPSGADPRTANQNRKVKCAGFFPLARVPGSLSGPCVFPVCFFFLFLFLSFGRGRHVPAPGWEGRRVKCEGTNPRNCTGRLPKDRVFQVLLYVRLSCVPSSRLYCTLSSTLSFYFPRMLSSDNANSVLSGARQVLQSSQDLFGPLDKYRLLWIEEDPLDCLLHAPRELSNRVTLYSWVAIQWYFSKRM